LARDFYGDQAHVAKVDPRFRPLLADPQVQSAIQRDDVPIPAPSDREGYFGNGHLTYWLSGMADLRAIRALAPAASHARVLDFGGASGRVARQIVLAEPSATVAIAELNHSHVMWCDEHFGPSIRAVKVGQYCHFPLADQSISLCVGFSVFTHLDAWESGWLAEIHRVLEKGAYAFLTIHSEHTWSVISKHKGLLEKLEQVPSFVEMYQPDQAMPAERLVFHHRPGTPFHCCNTFVHTNYVRRVWGKWFEIAGIHPQGDHNFQTVVVLQKK
jgi:hypothetical protein